MFLEMMTNMRKYGFMMFMFQPNCLSLHEAGCTLLVRDEADILRLNLSTISHRGLIISSLQTIVLSMRHCDSEGYSSGFAEFDSRAIWTTTRRCG